MSFVEWTEDMGEISGFGGGYEAGCRAMVKAGVEFWEEQEALAAGGARPPFDPKYSGSPQVFGLVIDSNDDAKALDAAILKASGGDATGAMHHAAINHVFAYRKLGPVEYVRQLRNREENDAEAQS